MSDDPTLKIKNIVYVLREITARWEDIGLGLRFDSEKLKVIKADLKKNSRCLIEVIHLWLLRERHPSWSTIINVLHEIEEKASADDAQHYITELKRISEHQKVTDRNIKRLVPGFDFSYEDSKLQKLQFETDPLNLVIVTENAAARCLLQDAAEWYEIGITLEVPKNELDIIEKDHEDCVKKMFEMISTWINNMVEACTWRTLVDALKQQGMYKVADRATEKASKILRKKEKIFASLTQSIPKRNWEMMDESKAKFRETVKKNHEDKRHTSLLEKVRTILNIPSHVSDSSLLDNLNQHIINKGKMTKQEVMDLLKTLNEIGEDFIEYPDFFTKQAKKSKKELTEINKHISELKEKKKWLEKYKLKLHIKIKRIETELKNTPPNDHLMRPDLTEARDNLKIVSTQLHDCMQELETAEENHEVITKEILNVEMLESCLRQYKQVQNMSEIYSDERVVKIFKATIVGAAVGAGVGGALGLVAGPAGFVAGAVVGGGAGALVGYYSGAGHKKEVERMLTMLEHTNTLSAEKIQKIQELIEEIITLQDETKPPITSRSSTIVVYTTK